MSQRLHFTLEPEKVVRRIIEEAGPQKVVAICDDNTAKLVYPSLRNALVDHILVTIPSVDDNKTLHSAEIAWEAMSTGGVTRHDLVVNIGGGMVTDLGGFVASTFKRGVHFVNVPTTLLGAVDAAVGGKTGVNFMGLKNEIGVFNEAMDVVISTTFYATLPKDEILSGYAEMIKHALLSGADDLAEALSTSPLELTAAEMLRLVEKSVAVKSKIVADDPTEKGIRKALNLGHTAGHAMESLAMRRGKPIPHGHAVAYGLVTEAILSHTRLGFPSSTLHGLALFVKENYPSPSLVCRDHDELLELMAHDKKNTSPDAVNFTLLREPGEIETDIVVDRDDIVTALDITADLLV